MNLRLGKEILHTTYYEENISLHQSKGGKSPTARGVKEGRKTKIRTFMGRI